MDILPPLPINIGKQRRVKDINGIVRQFKVLGEVSFLQSTYAKKAIYLQRIQFAEDGRIELRLGYYIIGKRPKVLGKWVWGQFATMLPPEDFCKVYELARQKGWIN
jgi:hypothetical protein